MLLFLSQTRYHRYADMLSYISIMLGFVFTWFTVYHNLILEHHKQGHHALIIFEGAGVGGGVVMWHTAAPIALMFPISQSRST